MISCFPIGSNSASKGNKVRSKGQENPLPMYEMTGVVYEIGKLRIFRTRKPFIR